MNKLGSTLKRTILKPAVILLKLTCASLLFVDNIGAVRTCHGPSMLPTFAATPEGIIEDRLSIRLGRPLERGGIYILNSPRQPGAQICKRIVGLPGDVVCVDPTGAYALSTEHCIVPPGHVWIIGDNAAASIDSRTYGPVPMALVWSRVVARWHPWHKRKVFRNEMTLVREA